MTELVVTMTTPWRLDIQSQVNKYLTLRDVQSFFLNICSKKEIEGTPSHQALTSNDKLRVYWTKCSDVELLHRPYLYPGRY